MLSIFFRLTILCSLLLSAYSAADAQPVNARNYHENFVIKAMRLLHRAQMTYGATYGNGNYATLGQLHDAEFIDMALAGGSKYGYVFSIEVTPWSKSEPASFRIIAVPVMYKKTGKRSFYMETDGILRGADHEGGSAGPSDPEIEFGDPTCNFGNEECTTRMLRTLH